MVGAFVLINTEVGSEEIVLEKIRKFSFVKEAHVVYGVYDIICRVEEEDINSLRNIITEKIRKLELVRNTITMILI
ncbi:MAG: Lrp/AsnC ligand binding domain-containing protein [Candidatus Hodarchaeales archaeon]|jgi:DNA-binding Lrp family transcriptional regulator